MRANNMPLARVMTAVVTIAVVMMTSLLSLHAHAGLTIEITSGRNDPIAIAVVPFDGADGLQEDVQNIISNDLRFSGFFMPVAKENVGYPIKSRSELHYRDWRKFNVPYVLFGQFTNSGGAYRLSYELHDVLGEKPILVRTLAGPTHQLRDIAHAVSDSVYETVTGIPGVFSTKILFVQDLKKGNKRYRLMHADADGGRETVLFSSDEPILSPTWSNDRRQIAYVSFETSRPAIYTQDLATGSRTRVTQFKGLNGAPAFSPDDKSLALVLSKDGNPEIYTLELQSGKLRRITNHFAIDTEPNWSHDGKHIIFTSSRGGSPQVYRVGLASKRVERLTFEGDYNARPRLTPDGESLVMVHRREGVFHIATQNMKTGDMRILTETWLDESPSVAPNGAMLLYATQSRNKGVLAAVSLDLGIKVKLPSKEGDVREPAWSPFPQKSQ